MVGVLKAPLTFEESFWKEKIHLLEVISLEHSARGPLLGKYWPFLSNGV
jgi:hypothetical protein